MEAAKPVDEVLPSYRGRLRAALEWPGLNPVPFPVSRGLDLAVQWFAPARVAVEQTTLLHHSESELLDYAVRHRGDSELHLRSMDDLWLSSCPVPSGHDPLLVVTRNGHHRRLVFETIGYPRVRGLVRGCLPDTWQVRREDARWVRLFLRLGIAELRRSHDPGAFTLIDPTGCVGWVLPPGETPTAHVVGEVVERMARLESVIGAVQDSRVAVLRDPDALRRQLAALGLCTRITLMFSRRTRA